MTRRRLLTSLALLLLHAAALAAGCGSGDKVETQKPPPDAGEASADTSPAKDVAAKVIDDPMNCVAPDAKGYCSPGGGQCDGAGPGGSAEICTADLTETPAHAWYCTTPCSMTTECAGGAECKSTPMGSRCVPPSCDRLLPEAGPTDSGGHDAAVDSAPDSISDGEAKDADAHDGHHKKD